MLRKLSSLDSLITIISTLILFSFFLPWKSNGCLTTNFIDLVANLYSKNSGKGLAIMSFLLPISALTPIAYLTGIFKRPRWIYLFMLVLFGYVFITIFFLILIYVKFKISRIIKELHHIEFGGYILGVGFILLSVIGTIIIFKRWRQKRNHYNSSDTTELASPPSPSYSSNKKIFFRTALGMLLLLAIPNIYSEFTPEGRARRYSSRLFEDALELIEKENEMIESHRKELQNSSESETANLEKIYRERRASIIDEELPKLEKLQNQIVELQREYANNAETSKAINKAIYCVQISKQKEHRKQLEQMSEMMGYRMNELIRLNLK